MSLQVGLWIVLPTIASLNDCNFITSLSVFSVWTSSTVETNENACAVVSLNFNNNRMIRCIFIKLANPNKLKRGGLCLEGINQCFVLTTIALTTVPVKLPVFCWVKAHLTSFVLPYMITHYASMIRISVTIHSSRMGKVEVLACHEMGRFGVRVR